MMMTRGWLRGRGVILAEDTDPMAIIYNITNTAILKSQNTGSTTETGAAGRSLWPHA